MNITDLVKEEEKKHIEEQRKKEEEFKSASHWQIEEDAEFLNDIREIEQLFHNHLKNLLKDSNKQTDASFKNTGAMLAILDKYIETRRNVYMITKTKFPICD